MGLYTLLNVGLRLKGDTPKNVLAVLSYLARETVIPDTLPDHPLFKCRRWEFIGSGNPIPEFPFVAHASLTKSPYAEDWYFNAVGSLKNYDGEIQHFLQWIRPHVHDWLDFAGYYKVEDEEAPTVIYFCNPPLCPELDCYHVPEESEP